MDRRHNAAIPCPGCGREYDITRFPFGRSFDCACGARVGLALEIRPLGLPGEPRFLADAMLGRLARWLRVMGYDAADDPGADDAGLVRRAVEERRILLTRDRRLARDWWTDVIYRVEGETPREQVREVVHRFGLRPHRLFTRCLLCNTPLESVSPADLAGRVPEGGQEEEQEFVRCSSCERIYWEGSHTARMRRWVEGMLEE